LADPTRRAVLDMLRRGRQPAGQIATMVSRFTPGYLQAPAAAAPGPFGRGAKTGTTSRLPAHPGTPCKPAITGSSLTASSGVVIWAAWRRWPRPSTPRTYQETKW